MLQQLTEGFLGLVLVLGNWLSPGTRDATVTLTHIDSTAAGYVVEYAMTMAWNEQLSELVDAGIPLRFRFHMISDARDTIVFVRTMRCNVVDFTYLFSDTAVHNYGSKVRNSRRYPQILLALRDYRHWTVRLSPATTICHVEAELLPSRVSQLNRSIDMSYVWGYRKVSQSIDIRQHMHARRARDRVERR